MSIDSSGFITTKPDGFIPLTDIIKHDYYYIYMEVPGLKKEDIQIFRQNVKTIIKGNKIKPYNEDKMVLEKNERSYGEF